MADLLRNIPAVDTLNTTRVLGKDIISYNIYLTRLVYPSTKVEWRPNAVILAPLNSFHYGLLAAPLIHFPINAPIFLTELENIPDETIGEISRLSPTGKNVPAKIIIVGPISSIIEKKLNTLGFSTFRIHGDDPISSAGEALEFRYKLPPGSDHMADMKNIMIVPAENYSHSLHAAYFSAHMGTPILFSFRDNLPDITSRKLAKYNNKNVYIIASENAINPSVERHIRTIVKGKVVRISGSSPYEAAINFAKFHDAQSMFGWNINRRDGWSFSFGAVNNWGENIVSSILAHLGKHGPLLVIDSDKVPLTTQEYILSLNPGEKHPPQPPFMHGFVLGDFNKISHTAQVELEEILTLHGKKKVDMHP